MTGGLHWFDGVVVAAYALAVIALGWYYSRRQESVEEFFVGNRSMNPLLIGVSIFVTLFSTISYLSAPSELINHGPVVMTDIIGIPITFCIIGFLMIPVYRRYRVTSAYELLEMRLGLAARLLGATTFILLRLVWMSLLIYLTAKAMLVMLGLQAEWLPAVALAAGGIAIVYSTLGGLRAVVITDFVQFLLLFGGAVMVIATVTVSLDGFGWIPTEWNKAWDKQPAFSFKPTVRVTIFGSVLNGILWWVCTTGGDQTAIQRFMATKDAAAARRSFLISCIANTAVSLVLALVGFALLGFYQGDPARLPSGMTIAENADSLFPYYIANYLPIGFSGLVVSGMFAAAMSSVDSGVNSITAVVMTDYVDRFRHTALSERARVLCARSLTLGIGITVISASLLMGHVPGNFLEMSQRTLGLFVAPLFTLFFLAMFVRLSTQAGAITGTICSLAAAATVAHWESLVSSADRPIGGAVVAVWESLTTAPIPPTFSFQWILPVSLTVGVTSGLLASVLFRAVGLSPSRK